MAKSAQVVALRKKGKTYREISKKCKMSVATVARILSQAQLTNGHYKAHKNGQQAYKAVISDLESQRQDLQRQAAEKTVLIAALKQAHKTSRN